MGKRAGKSDQSPGPDVTFSVRVKPGTSRNKVVRGDATELTVYLTARAVEGEANRALISLLAKWLDVPPSTVVIVRGAASRTKVVSVTDLPEGRIEALLQRQEA